MADLPTQGVIAGGIGKRLTFKCQGLRRLNPCCRGFFAIRQTMQRIEDVRFGRDAIFKCQFHRAKHGLFVVMQHKGQDLDHVTLTTSPFAEMLLQDTEGLRQFGKWRTIAQGTRFALKDGQIMAPVINRSTGRSVRAFNDPAMLAQHTSLGYDHQSGGIDTQTDRTVAGLQKSASNR